jgi:flagellar biosynthesis/type III secretory pathway protein FliH
MKAPRVLDNEQINWYKENNTKLNYKMLFSESEEPPKEVLELEEAEVVELSPEEMVQQARIDRDMKWKLKVEKTREEAYDVGYEEGKAAGYMHAQFDLEKKLDFINDTIERGLNEWKRRQELIDPGILDLAFEIAETILGFPVEHPEIRNKLELSLGPLLERIDNQSKPVLLVAESDFEYIQLLKEEYAPNTFIKIRVDQNCRPGEFRFESTDEVVVQNVKNTLIEFRKNLPIPTWE